MSEGPSSTCSLCSSQNSLIQHTGDKQVLSACDQKGCQHLGCVCLSYPGKDKDLQVAVRGTWSHDLGDHSSALETNAALALGLRYTAGQPREQKA